VMRANTRLMLCLVTASPPGMGSLAPGVCAVRL